MREHVDGMEKRVERRNWRQIAPCAREKTRRGLKIELANLWCGKRIAKKAQAGRGHENIWESHFKRHRLSLEEQK